MKKHFLLLILSLLFLPLAQGKVKLPAMMGDHMVLQQNSSVKLWGWADGKKVAVPIAKKDRFMYFVEITSFDGMTRSKLGVMEPDIEPEKQVIPDDNTLMVVPGSMFDIHKNRCGYGGGYYDTYTEKHSVKNTVGICFDLQIADSIPVEKFDRPLKMIITEERTIC